MYSYIFTLEAQCNTSHALYPILQIGRKAIHVHKVQETRNEPTGSATSSMICWLVVSVVSLVLDRCAQRKKNKPKSQSLTDNRKVCLCKRRSNIYIYNRCNWMDNCLIGYEIHIYCAMIRTCQCICVLHLKGIPEAMGFNNVSKNLGKMHFIPNTSVTG